MTLCRVLWSASVSRCCAALGTVPRRPILFRVSILILISKPGVIARLISNRSPETPSSWPQCWCSSRWPGLPHSLSSWSGWTTGYGNLISGCARKRKITIFLASFDLGSRTNEKIWIRLCVCPTLGTNSVSSYAHCYCFSSGPTQELPLCQKCCSDWLRFPYRFSRPHRLINRIFVALFSWRSHALKRQTSKYWSA